MVTNFKTWIKSAGIRAIKTFAQTFLSLIPMGAAFLGDVNWLLALSSAALAAVTSLVTSLAGLPEVKAASTSTDSASDQETKAEGK